MKFFHLSDLHIGKVVNGFSMLEEQEHAFGRIIEYLRLERPDAVLISGDVYDRTVPGVEAVRVFDGFLTRLAREDAAVMLIAGNHDSPERIGYASRILSERRLFFCGVFDGAAQKVTLPDEYGGVTFYLLPFIKPSSARAALGDRAADSYGDALTAALEASDVDYSARNVLLSHQFYTKAGVVPLRSESELNPVGGLDAVDAGIIERFDYAALGHLHGRQTVGSAHIRYCGSPVKYSFSECNHKKSVTVVEMREKGDLNITGLPLIPIRDMRVIKGPLEELISDGVAALANREDYLRVILTDEDEIIDPMGKLRSAYPNVMSLGFENSRTSVDTAGIAVGAERVERLSAYDMFGEFFLETQGSAMSGEQAGLVRELLEREDGQ